jgi:predicted O-methyltransferase YrrM
MNYYEEFKATPSNRTPYFQYVLSLFNEKPINILELGTSRGLVDWLGDGRAIFHLIEYIDKFGGTLTTVDIESENIENCKKLLATYPNFERLKNHIEFIVGDALKVLDSPMSKNTDLIYLDVGDEPQLTLECFEKINLNNTVVFVDDFSSKGVLLAQKYPNYCQMGWPHPIGHLMALYKKNQIKSWMFVQPIEK